MTTAIGVEVVLEEAADVVVVVEMFSVAADEAVLSIEATEEAELVEILEGTMLESTMIVMFGEADAEEH